MHRTRTTAALTLTAALAATLAAPLLPAVAAPADGTARGVVAAQGGLVGHVRPSTHAPSVYTFPNGSTVTLDCQVPGTVVGGNPRWYLVVAEGDANWVSARYVRVTGSAVQPCDPSDGTVAATATTTVNRRVGPTTADTTAGTYGTGAAVPVQCYTGTSDAGSSRNWYLTGSGRWVSAKYVATSAPVRYCSNL